MRQADNDMPRRAESTALASGADNLARASGGDFGIECSRALGAAVPLHAREDFKRRVGTGVIDAHRS